MELLGNTKLVNIFGSSRKAITEKPKEESDSIVAPPGSRISFPGYGSSFADLKSSLEFIKPDFAYDYIPVIRKLLTVNSSVSLATSSIVQLANTGYRIRFDNGVPADQAIKMREHLDKVTKFWGAGLPGLHGVINKLIYQLFIGGAISSEWVVKQDLSGIAYLAFLKAEQIRPAFDYTTNQYRYFQAPSTMTSGSAGEMGMVELNPVTFQYYGLGSDLESPIGIPPFISALDDLQAQLKMLRNIGFVADQLGIMGFLEVLMAKPNATEGESHEQYEARLIKLLETAKSNVANGVKDGIVAGYIDDHEFEFHSSTKDTAGVADIFDINQRMVSNGLLTSPQFLGGSVGGTETMITVVFTKMLSQLTDVQTYVKAVIERGLFMELILAGFSFKQVMLEFKSSTITDEVKMQQAKEIKQRVARTMYADGLINQDTHAWMMDLDKADQPEPRVEIDPAKIAADQKAKEETDKKDNKSDRSSRAKKKDQPKGRDDKK